MQMGQNISQNTNHDHQTKELYNWHCKLYVENTLQDLIDLRYIKWLVVHDIEEASAAFAVTAHNWVHIIVTNNNIATYC